MNPASEEFLDSIRPVIRDDGELSADHMFVAAMEAGARFHPFPNGRPYAYSFTPRSPYYLALYLSDVPRKEYPAVEYAKEKISTMIEAGMPFVGWAIGAEDRRITGPAQPGEGEFIKYLGRH